MTSKCGNRKRIILYTGKGGVGKTSVSAASALRCADLGCRAIVISTDPAHSLGDAFDMSIGPDPVQITDNLDGQEIDIYHQMELHWGTVQRWFSEVLAWQGVDSIIAEEASILPGMEEIAGLLQIIHLYKSDRYDTVVVDCAPTGETLRLLSLPEMAGWYLSHLLPGKGSVTKAVTPFLRTLADVPLPDKQVYEAVHDLIARMEEMQEILSDPETSTMRLVMQAEKMVVKEAQRTYTYLNLYNFATDAVVCNRLMPTEADSYFAGWHSTQQKYLELIHDSFDPIPVFTVPYFEREVVGLDMLRRVGDALYGDTNPAEILFSGQIHRINKDDDTYHLEIPLPFVAREDIQLTRTKDEMVINIGKYRRTLVLPRVLVPLKVKVARFRDNLLIITFHGDSDE